MGPTAIEFPELVVSPEEILPEGVEGPDPVLPIVPFPEIRFRQTGYLYHERITDEQMEFHENKNKFRFVQGSIGSGKSAMGTIECLMHSWNYRANFGFVIRKSMPQAKSSSIPDMMDIVPRWMILNWNKTDFELELLNQFGFKYMEEIGQYQKKSDCRYGLEEIGGISKIIFTSFEGTSEALHKWESTNLGWYMIDQAEWANRDIKAMLDHRNRRQPAARRAWFLGNFRRDIPIQSQWMWQIASENSKAKLDDHWFTDRFSTDSNKHNTPTGWRESLKKTLTKEEQAVYLHADTDKMKMTKQVFSEFDYDTHVIDHVEPPQHWVKGIGLDPGIGNPCAFVEIAFSPAGDIYVFNDFEAADRVVSEIAAVIWTRKTPMHLHWFIDATAGNRNQVTGTSVLREFISHQLPFVPAPRNVGERVMRIKEYLRVNAAHTNPWTGERGSPKMFFSNQLTTLHEEMLLYRIDEKKTHVGLSNETEKFRQYRDHRVDALGFVVVGSTLPMGLQKKTHEMPNAVSFPNGVPGAQIGKQPDFIGQDGMALDFSSIIAKAMVPVKKHTTPKRVQYTPYSEIQRSA